MLILRRRNGEGLRFQCPDGTEINLWIEGFSNLTVKTSIEADRSVSVERIDNNGVSQVKNADERHKANGRRIPRNAGRTVGNHD